MTYLCQSNTCASSFRRADAVTPAEPSRGPIVPIHEFPVYRTCTDLWWDALQKIAPPSNGNPRGRKYSCANCATKSPAADYPGVAHHQESPNGGTSPIVHASTYANQLLLCDKILLILSNLYLSLSSRGTTFHQMSSPLASTPTIGAEQRNGSQCQAPLLFPSPLLLTSSSCEILD